MSNVRSILLRHIRLDGGTQARVNVDRAAVDEYAEAMDSGASFPAVVVFEDHISNFLWLGDGFHRVAAAEAAGKKNIKAEIRPGGLRDAQLYAIGANHAHGLRRSNADKRKAVSLLLDDPEWSAWSNREIADTAGVTHTFVNKMKEERVETVSTHTKGKPAPDGPEPTPARGAAAIPGEEGGGHPGRAENGSSTTETPADPPAVPQTATDHQVQPPIKAAPLPPGPDDSTARIFQLERLVTERDAEIADLKERLSEMGDLLQTAQADNESMARILDADDLRGAYDKEVHRYQELARVTQSRNNGLMNENADLTGRLKSALRKIERLTKKGTAPTAADEPELEVREDEPALEEVCP